MSSGLAEQLFGKLQEQLVEFLRLDDVPWHDDELIGMQDGDEVSCLLARDDPRKF